MVPGQTGNPVWVVRQANVLDRLLGCSAIGVLEHPQGGSSDTVGKRSFRSGAGRDWPARRRVAHGCGCAAALDRESACDEGNRPMD